MEAVAWQARVEAQAARSTGRAEPGLWRAAVDVFGHGHRDEQARSRWRLAEVLQLLARGRTNRQTGAELHMSEKTASVHVSRILAELGAGGRTEAGALAAAPGCSPRLRADPSACPVGQLSGAARWGRVAAWSPCATRRPGW